MTNETILKKAIEKAVKNGWEYPKGRGENFGERKGMFYIYNLIMSKRYYKIIFSHDFAKAFWGEEDGKEYDEKNEGEGNLAMWYYDGNCRSCFWLGRMWEYHLMQMVLEKEPLNYIEKFL